jgi:predicted acylesterase/phospholipase RssA
MSNPPHIQIALQGGGAKLSALLAAMEPLQKLQRNDEIKVTRVAGTSAGAIVASLFAANVDLSKVRERLKRHTHKKWESEFSASRVSAALKLTRGRPLWSDNFFRNELKYFFDELNISKFEDFLEIQPILLATNLRESKAEIYSTGDLIPRILDSCAIPYCFRVWNRDQSPVIVDGGICENLPSEVLVAKEEEFGPVYAISFRESSKQSPNSALSFTFALLNTAMNHSVSRARAMLGEDKVFQIKTDISTFDFAYAFSDKSDTEYARIRKESEDFFRLVTNKPKVPQRIKTVSRYEWSLENRSMVSLGKIFESHHMNTRIKYTESSLEVTTHFTESFEDDYIIHKVVFRTLDEPIQCLGFSVNAEHDFSLEGTKFEVFKKDGLEPIETTHLPSIAGTEGTADKIRKRLLVYFLPTLKPRSGDYVIILKDVVKDFMKPLCEGKNDTLSITPYLTDEPIDKLSIVLHVPDTFPDLRMIQAENLGHKMNAGELSKFNDLNGFKSFGWMARDVKMEALIEDQKFRVDIIPRGA